MFDGIAPRGVGAPQGLRVPSGSPTRNRAHPADRYLSSAIMFDNNKARDIVGSLGTSSLLFGATAIGASRTGRHLNMVDAGVQMARTISGNVTVVVVCRRNTAPTSGVNTISPLMTSFSVAAGSYTGIEWMLGTHYSDPNKVYINKWNAGSSAGADAAWIDGAKQSGTSPCDITITNGQWYGITTTISSLTAGLNLTFGAYVDGYFKAPNTDIAFCLIYNRILPDSVARELSRNPTKSLLWPEEQFFNGFKAPATGVTVALTGIAGTGAVGSVGSRRAVAASGVAATGGVGTVVPSLALALTGVEGLAAVGDVGIGGDKTVALTGVEATGAVGDVVAVLGGVSGTLRRRGRYRVYRDVPVELAPAVDLAAGYVEVEVERTVEDAMRRLRALSLKASVARRTALVQELNTQIVAAVARAAEADEEDAIAALL